MKCDCPTHDATYAATYDATERAGFTAARTASEAKVVVACWGVHGALHARAFDVRRLLTGMKCFGLTDVGHPKHPLFLAKETGLVDFN